MRLSLDVKDLEKKLLNVVEYSIGFTDGVEKGKKVFLSSLGKVTIQALEKYIDTNARLDERALHHVYEWYQTGSPNARLFDIEYTVNNIGISINSTFKQSTTMSKGSKEPFYDKARLMEKGSPVVIKPKESSVLVFDSNGEMIFTKKPIRVDNPGGDLVVGSYEKIVDSFFKLYFTQAFLNSSGIFDYLSNPVLYKKNFAEGARMGKNSGIKTGYTWIVNAEIGVENFD